MRRDVKTLESGDKANDFLSGEYTLNNLKARNVDTHDVLRLLVPKATCSEHA